MNVKKIGTGVGIAATGYGAYKLLSGKEPQNIVVNGLIRYLMRC